MSGKKYKKFLVLYAVGTIISFLLYSYFVLNHKNLYMNIEYPMWCDVKEKMNHTNKNLHNFICIGDSRAKAGFKPNVFDSEKINSLNLAVGGGTPIEGYYTLLNYLKNNKIPKYLLLSYAPSHLMYQDSFWGRTVRFDFLTYDEYKEVINTSKNIKDNQTLGNGNKLIDYKIYPGKYLAEFKTGILEQRWKSNKNTKQILLKSKGHYFFGRRDFSDGLNQESSNPHFKVSPLLNKYFERLLRLALNNNITVLYYTMPFNKSSFFTINKNYVEEYNKYITSLMYKYHVILLNKLYFLPNNNFGDPSHLYNGANDVTKDIRNRFIQKIK